MKNYETKKKCYNPKLSFFCSEGTNYVTLSSTLIQSHAHRHHHRNWKGKFFLYKTISFDIVVQTVIQQVTVCIVA